MERTKRRPTCGPLLAAVIGLAGCSGVQLEETAVDADGQEESCVFTGDPNDIGGPTRDPGWACGEPGPAPFPVGPAF